MKNYWIIGLLLASAVLGLWYFQFTPSESLVTPPPSENSSTTILYQNSIYGFSFILPSSWYGYAIATGTWAGEAEGVTITEGPELFIRHPLWITEKPRQDIPVMIFTLPQWKNLSDEKFHIGAAPIGPTELGRNATYVFALPARYNFAFPEGFEEVDKIIQSNPLSPLP